MSFDQYIATGFAHLFSYERYQFFPETGIIQFYNCVIKVPMNIEQKQQVPLIRRGAPVIINGIQKMKTDFQIAPTPVGTVIPQISVEFKITLEAQDGNEIGTVVFS